jgi:hypothetical protein
VDGLAVRSLVDYAALLNSDVFDEYVHFSAELQRMDLQSVSFNVKIALFINLYNLLVLHGFLVLGPPASRQQVPRLSSPAAPGECTDLGSARGEGTA